MVKICQNGLKWSTIDKIAYKMVKLVLKWKKMVKMSKNGQCGPKWPKMVQNCVKWSKVVKRYKMVKNGKKWYKL